MSWRGTSELELETDSGGFVAEDICDERDEDERGGGASFLDGCQEVLKNDEGDELFVDLGVMEYPQVPILESCVVVKNRSHLARTLLHPELRRHFVAVISRKDGHW